MQDKSNSENRLSFEEILKELNEIYPITFPRDVTKILALKIGIHQDMKSDTELMKKLGLSITYLAKFLKWYTSSTNYIALTQLEDNARYDLSGQVVGIVTKEQVDDINKKLERKNNEDRSK